VAIDGNAEETEKDEARGCGADVSAADGGARAELADKDDKDDCCPTGNGGVATDAALRGRGDAPDLIGAVWERGGSDVLDCEGPKYASTIDDLDLNRPN